MRLTWGACRTIEGTNTERAWTSSLWRPRCFGCLRSRCGIWQAQHCLGAPNKQNKWDCAPICPMYVVFGSGFVLVVGRSQAEVPAHGCWGGTCSHVSRRISRAFTAAVTYIMVGMSTVLLPAACCSLLRMPVICMGVSSSSPFDQHVAPRTNKAQWSSSSSRPDVLYILRLCTLHHAMCVRRSAGSLQTCRSRQISLQSG